MPKLCTFISDEKKGQRKVGLHDGTEIVDLTAALGIACMRDLIAEGPKALADAEKVKTSGTHRVSAAKVKMASPLDGDNVGKVLCVGMNYADHCTEQDYPIPTEPIIFNKCPSTIVNPGDDIQLPAIIPNLDFEVELAIVIGKSGRDIPEDKASEHIFGYTVAHDVSARHWQLQRNGKQWFIGKTFDTFTPLGPNIVTADSINVDKLRIQCTLNGESVQDGNTDQLIFKCPAVVAWCSQFMTLRPGDVILTGTPPGVGCFRKPALWLKAGDVVTCEIEGIGAITNKVVTYDSKYTCPVDSPSPRATTSDQTIGSSVVKLGIGAVVGAALATLFLRKRS